MSLPTLPEAVLCAAAGRAGYGYLSEDGRHLESQSFAEVCDRALLVAGSLHAAGVRPGETLALIVPDARGFLTAFLGAACAGVVPAPLYPPVRPDQLDTYLRATLPAIRTARAAAILTTASLRRVLGSLQDGAPSVRRVLAVERLSGPALPSPVVPALDDTAFLQFTSGSTSDPKGVVLTHRNLAENVTAIAGPAGLRLTEADRGLSWLPLFHDMGLIGMALTVLYAGCGTTFLSPLAFLKRPSVWLRAIAQQRATISFAPNFAYDLCVRRVQPREMEGLDLSSWRVAGCGAEPVRAETLTAFARRFAPVGFSPDAFFPCYGMAEHTLAATFPPVGRGLKVDSIQADHLSSVRRAVPCPDAAGDNRVDLVSCGRPFPDHRIRIADGQGRSLPDRHVGQILLQGPSVFRGYLDREAQTRETLAGGWLHSGDLGYVSDGELYICGRVKDTIIVNGRNYYPQDLEQAASGVPDVRKGRVVAFGTRAADGRERVVLVVEPASGAGQDIVVRVQGRVVETTGVLLDEIVVAPAGTIPKTTSGKLQRVRVREQYEAGILLRPKGVTTRARLAGLVLRSQWVYARSRARRLARRLVGGSR